jgi:hypothetical protein
MACSQIKWTLIATVSDRCLITVNILNHRISCYKLPLNEEYDVVYIYKITKYLLKNEA